MKYLKVWTDFENVLELLDDDEVGRLFLAMLHYADNGKVPDSLTGKERFVWPVARRDIEHAMEESKRNTENGMKGGRPKTEQNQTKPEETEQNRNEPNESQKEKKGKEKKEKEKKSSFMDDDDAQEIQREQDRVLDAAEDAGFKMSNDVRAALIALYADNGLEKVLAGLKSCGEHGALNLAYLRACMSGETRKAKADVPAQKYTQRDYSNEQEEAMMRMIRGMAQ